MTFCQKCGKELPDGVACDCETTQNPVNESVFVTSSADNDDNDGEYLDLTKKCSIINIIAIVLFVGGVASLLLINEWVAAIIFFVAEVLVLVPNAKLQKLCKTKNSTADKKAQRSIVKETTKRIKAKDKNFQFSFIIAIICLISLVASFIVPAPLLKNKQNTNAYVPEETTTEVAEPLCYRLTVEEFMEDFSAMHKVLLVNDVTYRIEQNEENEDIFAIYISSGGIEYMTITCVVFKGGINSVLSNVSSEDTICEIWGTKTYDDATEFIGFAENVLVTYVLLNYQNPEEYPCDTDAFGDFVKLMTSAVKSGEGNAMYQHCDREYEHCTISLGYSATNGSYNGSCRLSIY